MANQARLAHQQYRMELDDQVAPVASHSSSKNGSAIPRPDLWPKRMKPKPSAVFSTYWRFAALRQECFFSRVFGRGPRRNDDPIISRYRFTNAYRASDRVSQYLIRNVIYRGQRSIEDIIFRILIFKFFNKIETWEHLEEEFGDITWSNYSFGHYDSVFSRLISSGERIYSAAYIMPSGKSSFGHERKHQNHLRIIELMMRDKVPLRIAQLSDMESVYRLLREYPCIGPFTGYQYTIDINYSDVTDFSEDDFVEAGPGALDGIAKCFLDIGEYTPADVIKYMKDVQFDAFSTYSPDFQDLWGRPLHLIDCQNLFCEVSKYARVAHPDVMGTSARSRIKQIYKESPVSFDQPWYPPKWRINSRVAEEFGAN